MNQIKKTIKGSIHRGLKYGGTLLKGYPFHYAYLQDPDSTSRYSYRWSQFTTPIKQRSGVPNINENRLWNMQLAARNIDGLIIQPGQIFGFWNRVPHPNIANGFREGPTLVRGKLITDVGGGLCQISTTLFNALLWADFEILERHNHTIDAHGSQRFFTLGQDATVASGFKDLIVKNNSQVPLQLRLQILPEKAEAIASVWGTEPCLVEVKLESKVLEELPPPTPDGMSGWVVETVRYVRENAGIEAGKPWQTDYRTIDLYEPHVGLHHDNSPNPASLPG